MAHVRLLAAESASTTFPRLHPNDMWNTRELPPESDARGLLRAARDLLAAPDRWTKWADARTATGAATSADDPAATAWSLAAALRVASKSAPALDHDHVRACATELLWGSTGCLLGPWNDALTTTHDVMLAALDHAIADSSAAPLPHRRA